MVVASDFRVIPLEVDLTVITFHAGSACHVGFSLLTVFLKHRFAAQMELCISLFDNDLRLLVLHRKIQVGGLLVLHHFSLPGAYRCEGAERFVDCVLCDDKGVGLGGIRCFRVHPFFLAISLSHLDAISAAFETLFRGFINR